MTYMAFDAEGNTAVCRFKIFVSRKFIYYSETCLKRPLKKDKTKNLVTNSSEMKVESIAECSILQYFRPALSDNGS